MSRNVAGWFEIYVSDMPRAKAFYESVLDTSLRKLSGSDPEMWGFPGDPNAAGASGALAKMPGFAVGANSTVVYFMSKDCDTELRRVEAAGGRIQKPKTSIGEFGFIALAYDLDGNMIGFHSMA
jgi:uncharacterized protein